MHITVRKGIGKRYLNQDAVYGEVLDETSPLCSTSLTFDNPTIAVMHPCLSGRLIINQQGSEQHVPPDSAYA
jgi:hypothetical protein